MIVHLKTKVETVFGLIDANGDLQKTFPVTAELTSVTPQALAEIATQILAQRAKLMAQDPGGN